MSKVRVSRQTPVSDLATAYLLHYSNRSDESSWAYEEVCARVTSGKSVEDAWQVTLALVAAAGEENLGYVGAGPLEDFVRRWGSDHISAIEALARNDFKFRSCLGSICLDRANFPRDILERLLLASDGWIRILGERET